MQHLQVTCTSHGSKQRSVEMGHKSKTAVRCRFQSTEVTGASLGEPRKPGEEREAAGVGNQESDSKGTKHQSRSPNFQGTDHSPAL